MKNEGHASIYARWFILPTLISVYFAFPNLPKLNIPSEWGSWFAAKKKKQKKLQWHPRHHTYSSEAKIKIHSIVLSMGSYLAGVHHL